jgi:hypothetical protein
MQATLQPSFDDMESIAKAGTHKVPAFAISCETRRKYYALKHCEKKVAQPFNRFMALETTAETFMPYFSMTVPPGAEAPKRLIPMMPPLRPTYRSQPKLAAASTASIEGQALTSSQRGGVCRQRTLGIMEYWKNGILNIADQKCLESGSDRWNWGRTEEEHCQLIHEHKYKTLFKP